jgi:hypothetical protein
MPFSTEVDAEDGHCWVADSQTKSFQRLASLLFTMLIDYTAVLARKSHRL